MIKVTAASRITPLLQLFYVLLVDYLENGKNKPDPDTTLEINAMLNEVVPVWHNALPSLQNAVNQLLKGRNKEVAYRTIGAELKNLNEHAKGDTEVPHEDFELFKTFGAFFRTESQIAMNKLVKLASASESPWVVQRLAPIASDQGSTRNQLQTLVNNLVGRKDITLTTQEAQQISELKPVEYKAYLSLRKAFNQAYKDALIAYIRKSGKDKVKYADALNYLKLNGIQHMMSEGFDGFIDDRFRLYTNQGKQIEGMPNAVTFPTIVMNESYGHPGGGDWVFRADRTDGSKGPTYYTTDFKKKAAMQKFKAVADLSHKMPQIRNKWLGLLKRYHKADASSIVACILEMLYEFSARIGSIGNKAGGSSTYGVATLLVKHAVPDASGNITLRYRGKDGVPTTHKLMNNNPVHKLMIHVITDLLQDKEPKDRIFTVGEGSKRRGISPAEVNRAFKSLGAGDAVTVHKIRTFHGTALFKELMDAVLNGKRPQNEKAALAMFKKMGEAVGKRLNHVRNSNTGTKVTGTTALNNYIDTSIQIQFFRELGVRIPKFLEKFDGLE